MKEEYVTLKKIIDFTKNNYIQNIWKQGISKLYHMYPTYHHPLGFQMECTKINIRVSIINGNNCLEIELVYPYKNGSYRSQTLLISKKDEIFFILSDDFDLKQQQEILNKIDFTNLYNLYMTNNFFTYDYPLTGYYNLDGEVAEVPITLNSKSISVGDKFKYEIKYSMKLNKCIKSEVRHFEDLKFEHKIKSLYASNPNFSSNLLLKVEDLPTYIQQLLYGRPPEESESQKLNYTTKFQKVKHFFQFNKTQ